MSTAPSEELDEGELVLHGRIMPASNATFLGQIGDGPDAHRVVYKPISGERPLWDFPVGTLADREVAAYLVSTALGWNVVPPPGCGTDRTARAWSSSGRSQTPGRRR